MATEAYFINKSEFKASRRHTLDPYVDVVEGMPDYLTSELLEELTKLPTWRVVRVMSSYRPDIISYTHYGTVLLSSTILAYNSMDLAEFVEGEIIRLFNISDYERLVARMLRLQNNKDKSQ